MISSQIDSLDKIFSGGLQNGIITEISGLRGTGKTQLALQFTIESLNNNKKIFIFVGVNGSGKTTTIGKIASQISSEKKVLIAACDTFRAAAINQLKDWAHKNQNDFFSGNANQDPASVAFQATEKFNKENIYIDLGSDQTSLHNPWAGGYYPVGLTFDESNKLMTSDPDLFKIKVKESLIRHTNAIEKHTEKGTYFFDYGNAFLLEASRAGADIMKSDKVTFKYPSYVQDIICVLTMDLGLLDGYVLLVNPQT